MEKSLERLHIILVFVYLVCQLAYACLSFYVFYTVMDYFRSVQRYQFYCSPQLLKCDGILMFSRRRTLFAYRQRRMPTHDFIYRISSVRQVENEAGPTAKSFVAVHALAREDDRRVCVATERCLGQFSEVVMIVRELSGSRAISR